MTRNLDLSPLVPNARVAITKTNGDRVAGTIRKVELATKAHGLRYEIVRLIGGRTTIEAVDIAAIILR